MKKLTFLLSVILFAALLLMSFSCQQKQQSQEDYQNEVKQKIAKLDKLYFESWEKEDLESHMTYLDEDFINMFYLGMAYDKKHCREAFQDVFNTYSIEDVEFDSDELIVDWNYAIETGLLKQKWISNDIQDTTYFDMRLLTIFKKQEDGNWKMFRLIGQQ